MLKLCRWIPVLFFALTAPAQTLLVRPYVQPGNGTSLTGTDVKVVAWMTDQKPAEFAVEYGPTESYGQSAKPVQQALNVVSNQNYFTYAATLTDLPFDHEIFYRVTQNGKVIQKSAFHTRKPSDKAIQFVVVGDTADGKADQKKVAFQIIKAAPEFLIVVGDIVYPKGRVSEYLDHFWNEYNYAGEPDRTKGVPLMRSVPFYAVLGNHDVMYGYDLAKVPDGLGAFYFFHPPLNGPKTSSSFVPVSGSPEAVAAFKKAAGQTFPALGFYSFDDGPAHFLCLDANAYVNPNDPTLREWIQRDLSESKAAWKFVCFHQPGFHASTKHFTEQKMRLLSPIFEATGVEVVFAGHVHNYQRSKPLKFTPALQKQDYKSAIPGQFTVDEKFDGQTKTKPSGIVYIVTGGGGASLYDPELNNTPDKWKHDAGEPVDFTAKLISDRHSFTLVHLEPKKFELHQIDDQGAEIDQIQITK